MSAATPNVDDSEIANLIGSPLRIEKPQDILELLADGGRRFIVEDSQIAPEFFDLSTGFAGDVLQKCSNYGIQVAVVGEYETGRSTSFQQFARESNRGKSFVFVRSVEEALTKLAAHSESSEQRVPMILSRAWQRPDGPAVECFSLQSARGALLLSGQITSVVDQVPCLVNYGLVCDQNWMTREAHVHVTLGGVASLVRIIRHEDGTWQVNGEERVDLYGAVDLDIQWTPATNTLPIKRLELKVGESWEVDAAWVQIPGLSVQRLPQKYTRVRENVYVYESGGGTYTAEVVVDEAGFVERYGDVWFCIGKA